MNRTIRRTVIFLAMILALSTMNIFAVSSKDISHNDSLLQKSFASLLREGKLTWDGNDSSVTATETDSDTASTSITVSGKNEDLSKTRFRIADEFDFDSATIQRIMIVGEGQKNSVTKVNIYLDGSSDPVATITLSNQNAYGKWDDSLPNKNAEVSLKKITGKHSVELMVCQYDNDTPKADGTARVVLDQIQFVAESIPVLSINIDESSGTIYDMNNDEKHETKCYGDIDIIVPSDYEDVYGEYAGNYELEYIRGRGNSSWNTDEKIGANKHPYKLKLDKAVNLMGMGKNKHWALIANSGDGNLLRNALTYTLGQELGLEYTPHYVNVDVMMNGQYIGSYLLCETVRVDQNRVDIDDLEKDGSNVTGGYLLGASYYGADDDAAMFTTDHGQEFNVSSPAASDDPNYYEEITYIKNYMQRVENSLYRIPSEDTGELENPFDLMDQESAIKYFWVQEFSSCIDFWETGSTYCYKKRDGKLYWGPLWDFDNAWNETNLSEKEWARKGWFKYMLSFDDFSSEAMEYYKNTFGPTLDKLTADGGFIDQYADALEYSAINNGARWFYMNYTIDGFQISTEPIEIREYYEAEPTRMKESIQAKNEWCEDNLSTLPVTVKAAVTPDKAYIYSIKAMKKSLKVELDVSAAELGGSSYQIAYKLKGTHKWKYKTTTKRIYKLTKLKRSKKYYVKARACRKYDGKTYYGKWSKTKLSKKIK